MEDVPVNYTTISYHLTPNEKGTLLHLTHEGFEWMKDSQKTYEKALKNWEEVLKKMKETAEEK